METAASLEKECVLVEHEFEYITKEGSVISIKPHERYILLKRTNEHWWHVCQDNKTKPFYIPAKYVKVLSSSSRSSNGTEIFQACSEDVIEQAPCTQYSYTFLPVDPQPSAGMPSLLSSGGSDAVLSRVQKAGTDSKQANSAIELLSGDMQQLSVVRSRPSHSMLDLSVVNGNAAAEAGQVISQGKTDGGRTLGPLRTFHNSKKILDPQKRISFMSPPHLKTTIRPTQSLNDLQAIKSEPPASFSRQLEGTNIPEIQFHVEELLIQQINMAGMGGVTSPEKPPTPEADYPEYGPEPEEIENYPQTDYDGLYVPPPPYKVPSDDHFSGWSWQMKDGQKLYTNSYNGDMWLQSQDKYGKTYFHTPDGSNSMWDLPQLGSPEFQKGSSDLDQNSNTLTNWQQNYTANPLQKETETKGLEKAGVLHKAKIAEHGKRLRKNWSASWTVLEGGILTFFKDTKNLSSSSLKQSVLTTPEHTLKLQGASIRWATKEKSSKKHVMQLKTRDGAEYLIHHDSESITTDWFTSISKCIGKNIHVSSEYTSENETESLQEFGSTEKLGIKDEKEKKTAGQNNNNSDSDRNVRAKLRKFLQRRPTLQSLRDKGYIRDQVFGCHLHELCEREKRNVPEFVSKSIEVVEKRGLDIDGLYRISGNLAVIQKLRYKVDHDENFNLDDGRWEDVHVITGALKLFFRELPEPLFPYSYFDKFVEAIRISDQNQKKIRLKELVLSLPSPNLETMRLLFRHLCSVVDYKESNRMSLQSVAIVFGPTLLKPEVEAANIAMYMVFQNQIVEQILIHYKYIFNNS
ncbi:rho GTPase-activating protein 27 isoform X2 [Pseudophryne corroboree]|uniref:rho GTPase-activating protein 27 isoform X2 n=1 Tax=Pseudophryne corroboree TaxID=495146 RepID=UPI00308161DA